VQKEVGHPHSANASHRPAQIVIRHLQVTTYYNVPPLRVPHLVLREGLLARLEAAFERSTLASSRSIVVLFGTGGAGKTQLALEYCRRMKARGLRAILWVDASSRNALYSGMEMIAKQLMPGRVLDDRLAAATLVKDVLSSWDDAWLMVFDNLDNPSDIPDILHFFPNSRCGSILVTSRFAGSKELGQSIKVDCMGKEEGRLLLLHCSETDSEELAAVEQILTQVGYLLWPSIRFGRIFQGDNFALRPLLSSMKHGNEASCRRRHYFGNIAVRSRTRQRRLLLVFGQLGKCR
jgi:NB-ARC domain